MRKLAYILGVFLLLGATSMGSGQERPFEGQTVTVAVYAGGVHGAISGPLYLVRPEWEKLTGAKLNIVEIPFPEMYEKIFTDLRTGAGVYDGFITSSFYTGDLIAGNYIIPIDDYMKDPKFPSWDPADINPASRELLKWGEHYYGTSFDCDAEILYYRRDLWEDPEYQAEFKAMFGYELPNPPKTWEQVLDCARFFNGRDLNGDGEPDYGFITLFSGVELGMWFMTLAGAYVEMPGPMVDRYHNVVLFDPETMEPLIKSPGFAKALTMWKELFKCAPPAALGWGLTEQWDLFLKGRVAITYNCGDLGTLAQDPTRSTVQGKLLCAPVPGSLEVWDRENKRWVELEKPNRIGNIHGASWHGMISALSKHKEATYHLFAYLASPEVLFPIIAQGWTGVDPGHIFAFPPEASGGRGTGSLEAYLKYGADRNDMLQYLRAYWQNYYEMDAWIPYLRIPGAAQMYDSFTIHLSDYLAGKKDVKATQEALYDDLWNIVKRRGVEAMKAWYQASIGYNKPAPRYTPTG